MPPIVVAVEDQNVELVSDTQENENKVIYYYVYYK